MAKSWLAHCLATILLIVLVGPTGASPDCGRGSFHFVPSTITYATGQIESGVLLVGLETAGEFATKTHYGTAFLIHRDPPILMTAKHVVAPEEDQKVARLYAIHPRFPDRQVALTDVVAHDSYDLAIVKADRDELFESVRVLELNLNESAVYPKRPVSFLGFGLIDQRLKAGETIETVPPSGELLTRSGDGFKLRTGINVGDSGAPLYMDDGTVIGVVTDKYSTILAHALDILKVRTWIEGYLVKEFGDDAIKRLKDSNDDVLADRLSPINCNDQCWTNLDIETVSIAAGDVAEALGPQHYLRMKCPLRKAALQRGLFLAVDRLDEVLKKHSRDVVGLNREDLARDAMAAADEIVSDQPMIAMELYSKAAASLTAVADLELSKKPGDVYAKVCRGNANSAEERKAVSSSFRDIGFVATASSIESLDRRVSCGGTYFNDRVASLLADVQTAELKHAKLAAAEHPGDTIERVNSVAALNILIAKDPSAKLNAYENLAVGFHNGGEPESAAKTYASAWAAAGGSIAVGAQYKERVKSGYELTRYKSAIKDHVEFPSDIGSAVGFGQSEIRDVFRAVR